jgi:hypothetical protein
MRSRAIPAPGDRRRGQAIVSSDVGQYTKAIAAPAEPERRVSSEERPRLVVGTLGQRVCSAWRGGS